LFDEIEDCFERLQNDPDGSAEECNGPAELMELEIEMVNDC